MSNKNKKIKKLCPHCRQRNKFSKKNWFGAEKTKCKYCGKILANIKEYEIPIIKLGSSEPISKKSKLTPDFYNATKPALNLGKEEKEPKGKGWILIILVGLFICFDAYIYDERDMNTLDEVLDKLNNSDLIPPTTQELCSEIRRVPAWVQDNEIIDYGYKSEWNVTYLVKNKICFLYSATCSVCHKQIAEFGNQWVLYVASGNTQECW